MATALISFQHDANQFINYTGSDGDHYPTGGALVVPSIETARVSAKDLDAMELASSGKIVLTTDGDEKALEVRGLGIADPAVVDTTVIDSGAKGLSFKSDVGVDIAANHVGLRAIDNYHSTVEVANASTPTFHHKAKDDRMILGTGIVDQNDEISSGAFLETTPVSFSLGHDDAKIASTSGVNSRIRYEAAQAHEFFVGSDASTQSDGAGAIEIRGDKVIIRKDVDLTGTINSVATDTTTLRVEDQIIRLAHTNDAATANRDMLLGQSRTGLSIDTVPGNYTADGAYMSGFVKQDGTKLFVDDTQQQIDVQKAQQSGIFAKEFAFHLNQGAKVSGKSTLASRLTEPYWQVTGGSLRMSHTVPAGNGKAKTFSLGWRITDRGDMELVRVTRNLAWSSGSSTYVADSASPDTVHVLTRYVAA